MDPIVRGLSDELLQTLPLLPAPERQFVLELVEVLRRNLQRLKG